MNPDNIKLSLIGQINMYIFEQYGTLIISYNRHKKAKKLILECGSGLSTLIMAPIAEKTGVEIISLEDNVFWGERVTRELGKHGLKKSILHHVKLIKYDDFDWYDTASIEIGEIDLCICDAPPGSTRGGRTGLFHLHGDKFIKGGKILVDDMIRQEEQDMVSDWKRLKNFDISILGDIDKHAVLTITE